MTGLPGFAAGAGRTAGLHRPVDPPPPCGPADPSDSALLSGTGALALFSQVGQALGVTLGVNLVNALVLGLLGVPGFGLLLMLQWVLK